jgi:hypothetical protein
MQDSNTGTGDDAKVDKRTAEYKAADFKKELEKKDKAIDTLLERLEGVLKRVDELESKKNAPAPTESVNVHDMAMLVHNMKMFEISPGVRVNNLSDSEAKEDFLKEPVVFISKGITDMIYDYVLPNGSVSRNPYNRIMVFNRTSKTTVFQGKRKIDNYECALKITSKKEYDWLIASPYYGTRIYIKKKGVASPAADKIAYAVDLMNQYSHLSPTELMDKFEWSAKNQGFKFEKGVDTMVILKEYVNFQADIKVNADRAKSGAVSEEMTQTEYFKQNV